MSGTESTTVAWHTAYPAPKSVAKSISREELLELMKQGRRDYLLVDLRRADHEGGLIRGSINLPAQSLYPSIPTLYRLIKAAGIVKIIWFCVSSRGRGPRAAAWFDDYLAKCGETDMESSVLLEGIKGWARAGDEYISWMDEYDVSVWA
ncbi:Rhodanese-like domain-containing protein [Trichoderma gracile]